MAASQIFYTIENEYSPERTPPEPGPVVRRRVSQALSDKLYVSPALDTASWCNETGYTVYLYVHTGLVSLSSITSHTFLSSSKCKALLALCVLTCLPDFLIFTFYIWVRARRLSQPLASFLLSLVFPSPRKYPPSTSGLLHPWQSSLRTSSPTGLTLPTRGKYHPAWN